MEKGEYCMVILGCIFTGNCLPVNVGNWGIPGEFPGNSNVPQMFPRKPMRKIFKILGLPLSNLDHLWLNI